VAERLAGAIDSWHRLGDCVWLRAGDSLPTNLAQSLGAACLHRWSPGEHRSGRMGDSRLDEELAVAPEGAVIVVELGGRMTAEVARLVRAIRPAITDRGIRMVIVAEGRFHSPAMPGPPGSLVAAPELMDRGALDGYSSSRDRARLLRYAGRRAAVLVDVMAAAQLWSQDAVTEALRTSYNLPSLLSRLTSVLVDQLTPEQRNALEVALTIGYWHPQMGTQPVACEQLRPWVVPMEQQWGWLRPIWVQPLRRELARPAGARHRRLGSYRATPAARQILQTRPRRCRPGPRDRHRPAPVGWRRGCSARSRCVSTARRSAPGTGSAARVSFAICCRGGSIRVPGTSCSRSSGPTSRLQPLVIGCRWRSADCAARSST